MVHNTPEAQCDFSRQEGKYGNMFQTEIVQQHTSNFFIFSILLVHMLYSESSALLTCTKLLNTTLLSFAHHSCLDCYLLYNQAQKNTFRSYLRVAHCVSEVQNIAAPLPLTEFVKQILSSGPDTGDYDVPGRCEVR